MKCKIKIVFNVEDDEYCVFVDGIRDITGYGTTEEEALNNFYATLHKLTKE
jgi:predicted RNase H-like HicB family nuclease